MSLWTPDDLAAAAGGRLAGAARPVTGASIDTRTLEPGDAFFAIRGERDGHDFAADALARGAALAVVSADRAEALSGAGPLLVVPTGGDDPVLAAMERIGRAARTRANGTRIVAVTGSVGKTGTKEALSAALQADVETDVAGEGPVHASVASYNNHWGVPLTLARMPADSAFGVFEVGMNHAGEIAPLTGMIRPHVALITTVEPVHIEFFRALAGIADAKGELFLGLEPGGVAILPRDNAHYGRLLAHAQASRAGRIVSFGEHPDADVRLERIVLRPDLSIVDARVMGVRMTYQVGLPGKHVAMNSLGVLAAVQALGADLARAGLALTQQKALVGRGERTVLQVGDGTVALIDESFNANPASMRAALANLAVAETGRRGPGAGRGRRIAVLGDMRELGEGGPAFHAELAGPASSAADLVFTAGPLMDGLYEALPPERRGARAPDAAALVPAVVAAVRPGDVVMVKSSKGTGTGRIVAALKSRYAAAPAAAAGA
jgi:UDP-N-acetylmuramoyl-tripeptide--D-alanyl-D-alanine ligase